MTTPEFHNRFNSGEAEALDQWLESITDPTRHPATGPTPCDVTDTSLKATAQQAHESIAAAERTSEPAVPSDLIWEKIMASTSTTPASGSAATTLPRSAGKPAPGSLRNPFPALRASGNWLMSAVMVAAVVIGIFALYQSIAGDDEDRITDYDPTVNPGLLASTHGTPDGTPVDSTWLRPITPENCTNDGSVAPTMMVSEHNDQVPPREYAPRGKPETSASITVAKTSRTWHACKLYGTDAQRRALETDRLQDDQPSIQYGSELDPLSTAILAGDPSDFFITAGEQGTDRNQAAILTGGAAGYALPNHMILLSDGRIAAPITRVVPPAMDSMSPFQLVEVLIFARDEQGQWLLDEKVQLCASCGSDSPGGPLPATPGTAPLPPPVGTPLAFANDHRADDWRVLAG